MQSTVEEVRSDVISAVNAGLAKLVAAAKRDNPTSSIANESAMQEIRAARQKAEYDRDSALQTLVEMERKMATLQKSLDNAQLRIQNAQLETTIAVDRAKSAAETASREQNRNLVDKVSTLTGELANSNKEAISLRKENEELRNRPVKLLPGEQGTVAEFEIESFLRNALGTFMVIQNVSKIGQGHEMDLDLLSRDQTVKIRLEIKSHTSVTLLPDKDIARFHQDVAAITPPATAAILFMRPAVRAPANTNIIKSRRDKTDVYQIGGWATWQLIETIHEILVNAQIAASKSAPAAPVFTGAKEVSKAFEKLCELVDFQNRAAESAGEAISKWTKGGAEFNRAVMEDLAAAHAANPIALPQITLQLFQKNMTKRPRGGKMKVSKLLAERKTNESDSDAGSDIDHGSALDCDSDSDSRPAKRRITKKRQNPVKNSTQAKHKKAKH